MKKTIIKSVGSLLILLTLLSTLTGCRYGFYLKGDSFVVGEWLKSFYCKLQSNKLVFDSDDVTLDFYYGLYPLYGAETLETQKMYHGFELSDGDRIECNFAIYLSDSDEIVFEQDENENIIDYENKVNARLWKFISYEEAFSTDYGFTYEYLIDYHHNEKITIPEDMFQYTSGSIYIHIVCLPYSFNNKAFMLRNEEREALQIDYHWVDGKIRLGKL